MIGFLSAKAWASLAAVIVAAALLSVAWYAGGSQCRAGIAEASLRHQQGMIELRDELSLEYAKTTAKLVRENTHLKKAADTLVQDLAVCGFSHETLNYLNNLRSN